MNPKTLLCMDANMHEELQNWEKSFEVGSLERRYMELVKRGYEKDLKSNYGNKFSIRVYINDYKGIPVDPKSLFKLLYHPLHPVRNILELQSDELFNRTTTET